MKSLSLSVFAGLLVVASMASAQSKSSVRKDDTNLKSIRPAACAMRASMNLSDCSDNCGKATGKQIKANGVDGSKKGG